MRQSSYDGSASLYLIPTPIGNLDDITVRALKVLDMVDFILCEDTRESSKLLNHFNIKKRLVSCHEYNEDKIKEYIISELKNGKNIGLITDQGSPVVSDPGYVVSKAVIENNLNVIALPGATAFVPALTSSGLSPSPFLFYGFLQTKESKIKRELISLSNLSYTLVFYEAPHRIQKTLVYMLDIFGNRNISIHREISKLHEEICRGTIQELIPIVSELKGEFVVVVDGNHENHDLLNEYPIEMWNGGKVHRINESIIHLMRGEIYEINQRTFFTFGGGYSIDRQYRKEGISWWQAELPTHSEVDNALCNLKKHGNKVDYVLTHDAPRDIKEYLGFYSGCYMSMYRDEYEDIHNALYLLKKTIQFDDWYLGHYHIDKDISNIHILYNRIIEL